MVQLNKNKSVNDTLTDIKTCVHKALEKSNKNIEERKHNGWMIEH